MNPPLLSIIIPALNCSSTIINCLDSVVHQSFSNYEILIIDGLSKDDTPTICKEYYSKYTFIRYYREGDQGVYDAMNKGVSLAKGKWIYFLGSDDQIYNHLVLEKIFCNKNLNFDVLYGNVFSPRLGGLYGGIYTTEKLLNQNICHQGIFFQKKIFETTGLFNLKYQFYADWDHNLKWFRSKRIKKQYVAEVIAIYADGGLSSKNIDNLFLNDNRWRYIKYHKNNLSLLNKLRMTKAVLKSAFTENRKGDALRILCETPYLFI